MAKKQYCYEYPRPALTVDSVIFREGEDGDEVLLILRKSEPYKGRWAIPGGFVEMEEKLDKAAARELEEETGLKRIKLELFGIFDDPSRDPRGRTISVAFRGRATKNAKVKGGDDAADAAWHPLKKLPPLAFDHKKVIKGALD